VRRGPSTQLVSGCLVFLGFGCFNPFFHSSPFTSFKSVQTPRFSPAIIQPMFSVRRKALHPPAFPGRLGVYPVAPVSIPYLDEGFLSFRRAFDGYRRTLRLLSEYWISTVLGRSPSRGVFFEEDGAPVIDIPRLLLGCRVLGGGKPSFSFSRLIAGAAAAQLLRMATPRDASQPLRQEHISSLTHSSGLFLGAWMGEQASFPRLTQQVQACGHKISDGVRRKRSS